MAETPLDRDGRVLSLEKIVGFAAHDIWNSYGRIFEFEDLMQDAWLGAIDAVSKFDDSLGLQLSTYANHRIRGAVIDGIRARDHLSRGHRLRLVREGAPAPITLSLDQTTHTSVSVHLGETIPDLAAEKCFSDLVEADAVRRAVMALPDKLQFIVLQYYWEGRTLRSISLDLRVTESRVSQLLATARAQLGRLLGDTYGENVGNEYVETRYALA